MGALDCDLTSWVSCLFLYSPLSFSLDLSHLRFGSFLGLRSSVGSSGFGARGPGSVLLSCCQCWAQFLSLHGAVLALALPLCSLRAFKSMTSEGLCWMGLCGKCECSGITTSNHHLDSSSGVVGKPARRVPAKQAEEQHLRLGNAPCETRLGLG